MTEAYAATHGRWSPLENNRAVRLKRQRQADNLDADTARLAAWNREVDAINAGIADGFIFLYG